MPITEDVRALCYWQPFGTLMLYNKVETRGYATDYRGLILICTTQKSLAKQNSSEARRIIPHYAAIDACVTEELLIADHPTIHLNGYAIAIGRLVECRKTRKDDNTYFMHWKELYAHVYEDVKRIKPFKFKGFQGRPRLISEEVKQQIQYL
jgi:hypothetical protein